LWTARHEVVARALGCRLRENRRFDFEEPLAVHVVADAVRDAVAKNQIARERRPAQIEIPILQPQVFGGVDIVIDRKRRRLGAAEQLDRRGDDFDLAGRHLRILRRFRTLTNFARDAHDELGTQLFRDRQEFLTRTFRAIDDHLHDPAAIANVDEDELSKVALLLHPAGDRGHCAGVRFVECACVSSHV
jgi:hypothetical protein